MTAIIIDNEVWHSHSPGHPMPAELSAEEPVEVRFQNGGIRTQREAGWWATGMGKNNWVGWADAATQIVAWRRKEGP